jgi:hypothetical protein
LSLFFINAAVLIEVELLKNFRQFTVAEAPLTAVFVIALVVVVTGIIVVVVTSVIAVVVASIIAVVVASIITVVVAGIITVVVASIITVVVASVITVVVAGIIAVVVPGIIVVVVTSVITVGVTSIIAVVVASVIAVVVTSIIAVGVTSIIAVVVAGIITVTIWCAKVFHGDQGKSRVINFDRSWLEGEGFEVAQEDVPVLTVDINRRDSGFGARKVTKPYNCGCTRALQVTGVGEDEVDRIPRKLIGDVERNVSLT